MTNSLSFFATNLENVISGSASISSLTSAVKSISPFSPISPSIAIVTTGLEPANCLQVGFSTFSGKVSIAARLDAYNGQPWGESEVAVIEQKVAEIRERHPKPTRR